MQIPLTKEDLTKFVELCVERNAELTRYADISDSGSHQMHFDYIATAYEVVGKDLQALINNTA